MKRREKKYLDEKLYERCKDYVTDGHTYDNSVRAYIEFYELMIPPEQIEPDGE